MHNTPSRTISQRFTILDSHLLGRGATGNVYLGYQLTHPPRKVAVKTIDLKSIDNDVTKYLLGCQITALSELSKLQQPGTENIVKLLQVATQNDHIYIVTELLEGGTLADHLKLHPKGLPHDEALFIFRQILEGYLHMRNKSIVHRDLKPDNVLFRTKPQISKRIAIIDFGYCEMAEVANKPQGYYNVGSPKYMSPEAYEDNMYSEKSDIWAIGVMLYEMAMGKTCDEGHSMESYLEMVHSKGVPIPHSVNPVVKELLSKMLCAQSQRYNCLQLLQLLKQLTIQRKTIGDDRHNQIENGGNKNNPVFRSAFFGNSSTPAPGLNVMNSQINGFKNTSPQRMGQIQDYIGECKNEQKMVKCNSLKFIPVFTFNGAKNQSDNMVNRIDNTGASNIYSSYNIASPKRTNDYINHQYFSSPIKQRPNNQKTQPITPSSNRKINFNIVAARPTSPSPIITYSHNQLPIKTDPYRLNRVTSEPQSRDQNTIKIQIRNQQPQQFNMRNNMSLEKEHHLNTNSPQKHHLTDRKKIRFNTDKKQLVGGFTIKQPLLSSISNLQKNQVKLSFVRPQFVYREAGISKIVSPLVKEMRKVGFPH